MATPYLIGGNGAAAGSTTLVISVATGTATGDQISVAAMCGPGTTVSSVADSKGNTYTKINSNTAHIPTYHYTTTGTTVALTTSDTITITYSSTTQEKYGVATGMTGVLATPDQVPTPTVGTAVTSGSITSGTLSQPTEFAIAIISTANGSPPTWGSGFTQISQQHIAGNPYLSVAYLAVNATTAITASATFASSNFTMLMATFVEASTSLPYLLGSASAASGGATTLNVPIASGAPVSNGDTLYVGALCTSGSVTGVTDAANNTYTLVQSETTNAGCQLYTFQANNIIAPTGSTGTGSKTGLVGATTTPGNYAGDTTREQAATSFDTAIKAGGSQNYPLSHTAQKIFWGKSVFKTTLVDGSNRDLTSLSTAGCTFYICVQPALDGSDLSPFQTAMQDWQTLGAKFKVVIYQEPQGQSGLTASTYIQCVRNYASMLQNLGIPVVYDASGGHPSEWESWYPGDAYVDEVILDYYGNAFISAINKGQTDPTLPLRQLADAAGKPFGFGEIGDNVKGQSGITPGTSDITKAQWIEYITYIQDTMTTRLSNGLTNGPVMWFNGADAIEDNTIPNGGGVWPSPDFRIPYIQGLWNALTTQATVSGINVAYSTNASVQGAIAVGDKNVSGSDKIVGATATTGTTASVATGTLSQAEEHIIAFVADLAAGGVPTWGDSLSALAHVEGGTTAFLSAAAKSVSVTTSDTPSATIVSTTWSISAVTDAVQVPVIITTPPQGNIGQAYSVTLSATGGVGALTWTETGTLPTGLTLTSAGVLSGTPSVAGSYPVTLIATDTLGLQGTLAVTIVIAATAPVGTAPATPLPGNVLSLADSDSETSTGYTWTPLANATTPTRTTFASLTGGSSTEWTVPATGLTQVTTAQYAVSANQPYVASAYLLAFAQRLASIGIAWFDSTGALIDVVSQGTTFTTSPAVWQPLTCATVSPANAAFGAVVATVYAASAGDQGATAGDVYCLDLAYLAQTDVQILIDWNNPTFQTGAAAGQMFMDVTPWVRLDIGVDYTRGRQDAVSQIQAGSATFSLQNDTGTFASFNTTSIPASLGGLVGLQARTQINFADETGQWWTRFDGPIAQIDYTFDNTGNTSTAAITLTDALSSLNRQDPLFCWTKEQVLADNPTYHWSLDDPGNVGGLGVGGQGAYGVAAETSGSNGPPMRLFTSDSSNTGTIAWQDTTAGVETLANAAAPGALDGSEFWTAGLNQPSNPIRGLDSGNVGPFTTPIPSVRLVPKRVAQSAQNLFIGNTGYSLIAELPTPLQSVVGDAGYTLEAWVTVDPAVGSAAASNYGPYIALSLGNSRNYSCLVMGLWLSTGNVQWGAETFSQPPAFRGLNWPGTPVPTNIQAEFGTAFVGDTARLPHHLVVTIQYLASFATQIATFFVDGVQTGNFALPVGQVYDTLCVGGAFGGTGAWDGNISLVSVYPYSLSSQQISLHAQLGQYGMWETPGDDALAQVASFASIPSFWSNLSAQHNGLALMEYQDITGSNALTSMQLIAQAENGLLYVDANGALNFHTRDWRMGYGAPDLLMPAGSFDANMNYQMVDQFMCNEMAVAGSAVTGANGQQGSTLSTTTGNINQPANAVASANTQAGFINAASQAQYGVYASSPVSSPISLPLITWSRAFAQLGIPGLTYWPDPNLLGIAAWNANSRSTPWLFPAQLKIDLLTLTDPGMTVTESSGSGGTIQAQLGASDFYGLEIDMMVAPAGPVPASMPNESGTQEWFIEGISESKNVTSWTMTLNVSPAQPQRAWIPGDPTYGVLGSTTRVGISQSDVSVPQADGKDVSHDAGPPYWPPTFSTTMNNPSGSGHAFVGDMDMRGMAQNLQDLLTPAMLNVEATQDAQSVTNGALSDPSVKWDFVHVDTEGGMGAIPGYPQWYVVTKPGWYEIDATVRWSTTAAQAGFAAQGWIAVAQGAAQAIAQGSATPATVAKYVCPVGDTTNMNSASMDPTNAMSTRMYLGLGDMVAVCAEQNTSAARNLASTGGTMLSLRRVGIGTVDDRTEVNSSLGSGGTVTIPVKGVLQQAVFTNTHTYCYHGQSAAAPYARRNADGVCFQGIHGAGALDGSQTSQVVFSRSALQAVLTGHQIQSATLKATNMGSWFNTGSTMILGTTTITPGNLTYHPTTGSSPNLFHQHFQTSQQLTFIIPVSMVKPFVTGSQTAFILGDAETVDLARYGAWVGGPGSWTLTVNYV